MIERHLICHIYPGRTHNTWRRTVAHLRARWSLFTGRREISIAIDATTVDPVEVIDAFGDCEASFRIVENNPALGESVSFPSLLRSAANEAGHTFYCHSKGASYAPCSMSEKWADVMFHLCLDYPGLVGACLKDHPIAGPFRRIEQRIGVDWHYSGTFFWFRHGPCQLLTDWPAEDRNDVERWPARVFSPQESGDLGLADPRNLYDEINWRSWITMRFRREILWSQQRREERLRCPREMFDLPMTIFEPLQRCYEDYLPGAIHVAK